MSIMTAFSTANNGLESKVQILDENASHFFFLLFYMHMYNPQFTPKGRPSAVDNFFVDGVQYTSC